MVHSLAYKECSNFTYTPCDSNIPEAYKHSVVPISLHRIRTRCTTDEDKNNHYSFIHRILKHRHQDPKEVSRKTRRFFSKARSQKFPVRIPHCSVIFDKTNNRHAFMTRLASSSTSKVKIVYKSQPKLSTMLYSKQKINGILTDFINK